MTRLVPDTSVLIDGRISEYIADGHVGAQVLVPMAAVAELEAQANRGAETGVAGLDELALLQRMAREGDCVIENVGRRPDRHEIEAAGEGAIDALIRDLAVEYEASFLTSDRVQAHAAEAQGIDYVYLRPIVEGQTVIDELSITSFFDAETMSVHLKADCVPMVKRGTPAGVTYEPVSDGARPLPHAELRKIIKECIEFAKRDYRSFVELERHGCTVVQMGPMRVTIAQPPFSDGLEITAVRPIRKTTIDDYELPDEILDRLEEKARGVFVAGPPGSGKSTFAAAVVEHLHTKDRVIKTMEQPRDLQVPPDVTQYGALDKDMTWTGEVMLLVRPDHVVFDEVRTTDDFTVFADMRLAGIGLFGVTHANRPIDAVQRLIGRVDLGMIPQIVDTVVFIDEGAIGAILELEFTVKVPEGMNSEDLARPVVQVKDVQTGTPLFELYSFGEQIVVMPLDSVGGSQGRRPSGASALAGRELQRALRRQIPGPFDVEVRGDRATIFVDDALVPEVIGKGGRNVQALERRLGIRIDVRAAARPGSGVPAGGPRHEAPQLAAPHRAGAPQVRRTGSNVFLLVAQGLAGADVVVEAEGAILGEGRASKQGKLRFKAASAEGHAIMAAQKSGLDITVRRA